jgi:hypothetical protein
VVARNIETLAAKIPAALWADLKAEGLMRSEAPVPVDDEPGNGVSRTGAERR